MSRGETPRTPRARLGWQVAGKAQGQPLRKPGPGKQERIPLHQRIPPQFLALFWGAHNIGRSSTRLTYKPPRRYKNTEHSRTCPANASSRASAQRKWPRCTAAPIPTPNSTPLKEANANCVMGHRRQFLAELVVATIVADGAEGKTCCSGFTLCRASFGSEPTGVGSRLTR